MSELNAELGALDHLTAELQSAPEMAATFEECRYLVFEGQKGDTGEKGDTGDDGVSPAVTIAEITGGHTITITDADHPSGQSFNVMDGDPHIDDTLSVAGDAADAKAIGDALGDIADALDAINGEDV